MHHRCKSGKTRVEYIFNSNVEILNENPRFSSHIHIFNLKVRNFNIFPFTIGDGAVITKNGTGVPTWEHFVWNIAR